MNVNRKEKSNLIFINLFLITVLTVMRQFVKCQRYKSLSEKINFLLTFYRLSNMILNAIQHSSVINTDTDITQTYATINFRITQ